MKKQDRYDHAVAYLTAAPHEICEAWSHPGTWAGRVAHPAGCLFRPAAETHKCDPSVGCLTQIADGHRLAETSEITTMIRADTRIPLSPESITVDDLPVFAEWQRRLDTYFGRKAPLTGKD